MTPDDRAPEPPAAPPVPPSGQDTQPLRTGERAPGTHETLPIAIGDGTGRPAASTPPAIPPVLLTGPGQGEPSDRGTGYGAAPGYGTPAPGYGTPAPGYSTPPPGYSTPSPGYSTPPPGYGALPPGYGPPVAPPPGYPGAPGAYGWAPSAPPVPTDGLAVASLVTSVSGLVLLAGATGPIGVGLGIGALARLRRTGARGRGMAIAGIVTGAVGTVVIALVVWVTVAAVQWVSTTAQQVTDPLGGQGGTSEELERLLDGLGSGSGSGDDLFGDDLFSDPGEETGTLPSYVLPQDVAAGTCWEQMPEYYDLSDAVVVPCADEHDAEVVAVLTATGAIATDLSADDPVLTEARTQCEAAVAALDPGLGFWGVTDVWLPHPDQVASGQLIGYCVFGDTLGRTGSLTDPSGVSS